MYVLCISYLHMHSTKAGKKQPGLSKRVAYFLVKCQYGTTDGNLCSGCYGLIPGTGLILLHNLNAHLSPNIPLVLCPYGKTFLSLLYMGIFLGFFCFKIH